MKIQVVKKNGEVVKEWDLRNYRFNQIFSMADGAKPSYANAIAELGAWLVQQANGNSASLKKD